MLELPGYIIEKQIGKGGMAKVYLALHEGLDRHVAIKVMSKHLGDDDSNFGERFISEARIVAKLSQQSIITVFDVGTHDGYNYIAMELLPGTTLDDKIKEGLTTAESLNILKQLAAALDYAHKKDIIHRDVKPENIMFREDGSAVLTDFGIAKSTTATNKMTATGTIIGTPHYMSPEQAQGHKVGSYSDIYSLGVVFYEMLTGKVPYDAESTIAVVFKHISEAVPELGGDLCKYQMLMNSLMAKDLEQRYHSGQDIISDIEQLEREETPDNATRIYKKTEVNNAATQINQTVQKQPPTEKKKSKTVIYASIAAALLLSIGAGGYFYIEEQDNAQAKLAEQQQLAEQAEKEKTKRLAQQEQKRLEAEKAKNLAQKQKAEENEAQLLKELATQKKADELNKKNEEQNRLAQLKKQKEQQAKKQKQLALNKKIASLLTQAETDLLNTKLNSAYKKYKSVLAIKSSNKQAKSGINRVADQYLALANNEALKGDYDQANKYIASAIQIAPTHKNLATTQQKVFDLKTQALARQAKKQLQEQQAQNTDEPVKEKKRRSFGGF